MTGYAATSTTKVMMLVSCKPFVKFWGVMNWVTESEKYKNTDLVLNHYRGAAEEIQRK
jgi:hypothetical protein